MNGKMIVVTGGAGFIGSHFVNTVGKRYPDCKIIVIDKLGVGSNVDNIQVPHSFIIGDVAKISVNHPFDRNTINEHVDYIFHFAAESHVDRSIDSPDYFARNNINATLNVLEYVRVHPETKLVNVSTDEVYGSLDWEDEPWTEDSPILPRSPYSASKASSDMFVQSYINTYGIKAITTRCSNNFGPNQFSEKFIPTILSKIKEGVPVTVYGDGLNRREWIPVQHHVDMILKIAQRESKGVFNIEGGVELSNLELIHEIGKIVDTEFDINFVKDRPGHDLRYAIVTNHSRYKKTISREEFRDYLRATIDSYLP